MQGLRLVHIAVHQLLEGLSACQQLLQLLGAKGLELREICWGRGCLAGRRLRRHCNGPTNYIRGLQKLSIRFGFSMSLHCRSLSDTECLIRQFSQRVRPYL